MRKHLNIFRLIGIFTLFTFQVASYAGEHSVSLQKSPNNLCDKASLQRGAKLYVNYCQGCHSLEHVRYKGMAKDIGIVSQEKDENGKRQVLEVLVQDNLNFVTDNINHSMRSALPKKAAEEWFGVAPPDLTLTTRVRGTDWVYTYLKSFYLDESRPWGVNNLVFPDVGMPHILLPLQGAQAPHYQVVQHKSDGEVYEQKVVDRLDVVSKGQMSDIEYDQAVTDLVNFLEYVGEPHKLERKRLGVWVMLFLILFTLFAYLLKREYWKDVH
jgi:ubiquinol-cytochrome c reductase cytochrome c1 subunit